MYIQRLLYNVQQDQVGEPKGQVRVMVWTLIWQDSPKAPSCLFKSPHKTEPVMAGADAMAYSYVRLLFSGDILVHNYICSKRDRLGFDAEIQIIFGTVQGEQNIHMDTFESCWKKLFPTKSRWLTTSRSCFQPKGFVPITSSCLGLRPIERLHSGFATIGRFHSCLATIGRFHSGLATIGRFNLA